jgi:hypothetical protein
MTSWEPPPRPLTLTPYADKVERFELEVAEGKRTPPVSREVFRSHRAREVRAREVRAETEQLSRMPLRELRELKADNANTYAELAAEGVELERPKTRGDCKDAPRPCPWVGCRYHLAIDVDRATGNIKHNFPDIPVGEWPNSCALDAADHGGLTLEAVGELMNVTRERIRQHEEKLYARLRATRAMKQLHDELPGVPEDAPSRVSFDDDQKPVPQVRRRGRLVALMQQVLERMKAEPERRWLNVELFAGLEAETQARQSVLQRLKQAGKIRIHRAQKLIESTWSLVPEVERSAVPVNEPAPEMNGQRCIGCSGPLDLVGFLCRSCTEQQEQYLKARERERERSPSELPISRRIRCTHFDGRRRCMAYAAGGGDLCASHFWSRVAKLAAEKRMALTAGKVLYSSQLLAEAEQAVAT